MSDSLNHQFNSIAIKILKYNTEFEECIWPQKRSTNVGEKKIEYVHLFLNACQMLLDVFDKNHKYNK